MNRTCEIHDTILQDDLKLRERPLKVLAAVDSFKGSMTSVQAGMAVKKVWRKIIRIVRSKWFRLQMAEREPWVRSPMEIRT